ncbi:hypothetical protein K474DRAFT_1706590 [Panus rudis PR-1116 ss-1]|nr:hypothetical protein K474DRAFT_1706590 [Panus rudis PR-1116 ss-1]
MSFSLLRRIWSKITNPTGLVGRDLEGNRYFEYPSPHGYGRTKRVVKYRSDYDMWTYIASGKRLPVQWTSWLSHTRSHPPTIEELLADLERQRRIREKVAMIEARDRELKAAEQLSAPSQTQEASAASVEQVHSQSQRSPTDQAVAQDGEGHLAARDRDWVNSPPESATQPSTATEPSTRNPWEEAKKRAGPDVAQTWKPRSIQRGA